MFFSHDLAIGLLVLITSALARPTIEKRQNSPPSVKTVQITLCKDWDTTGNGCYDIKTFIYPLPYTDSDNIVASNYATLINTGSISGISSLQVQTDGVKCTFGNLIISSYPDSICGGYTVTIASGIQYDLGKGNGGDYALNDNVQCYYCFTS